MRPALWAALLLGMVAAAAAQSNPTPAIINGQDAPKGRLVWAETHMLGELHAFLPLPLNSECLLQHCLQEKHAGPHLQVVPLTLTRFNIAPYRFRYIASLRPTNYKTSHFCGATLIHPRVILTAAHVRRQTL